LGAIDQALPQLERAMALYRDQRNEAGIARTQAFLGINRMNRGDFKGSEELLRQTVTHIRSQGVDVDPPFAMAALADLGVAIAYQHPGNPEAIALMRESIDITDRHRLNAAGAALVLNNLGLQLIRLGRLEEGEAAIRDALRRWDLQKAPPPERNSALRNLAALLFQRGDYVEAEQLAATAVDGFARLMPADHPLQPNFKVWWARTLLALGDRARGRAVALEAYAGYRKQRPPGHLELALPLITLGIAHRLDGQLQESERAIREARAILQKHPSSRDRGADAAGELGLTLRALGKTAESDALLKESYETLQTAFGDAHPLTKQALARVRGGQ
jgi:tetratricopeptide (TPR) repeat protein